jgi:hypothetical protein
MRVIDSDQHLYEYRGLTPRPALRLVSSRFWMTQPASVSAASP